MDPNELDPELEAEMRATMDDAVDGAQLEGIAEVAKYLRRHYDAYRSVKFSRKQAFMLTVMMFEKDLR